MTQRQNAHDLDCGIECDSEGDLSEVFPIPTSKAALEAIQVLQMSPWVVAMRKFLGEILSFKTTCWL